MMVPGYVKLMEQKKRKESKCFQKNTEIAYSSILEEEGTKKPYRKVIVCLKIEGYKIFQLFNSPYL